MSYDPCEMLIVPQINMEIAVKNEIKLAKCVTNEMLKNELRV